MGVEREAWGWVRLARGDRPERLGVRERERSVWGKRWMGVSDRDGNPKRLRT